jgi:hypothetical protein
MSRRVLLSEALLAASHGVLGQSIMASDTKLQAQIIALDKQGWEAWKDNEPEWFRKNVTDEYLSISSDGASDKAQVVKATSSSCKVKSYALDNFKFVKLDTHAVLPAFSATQDAVCDGKAARGNPGCRELRQARRPMARGHVYAVTLTRCG